VATARRASGEVVDAAGAVFADIFGSWDRGLELTLREQVRGAVASFEAAVLTEIYLCNVCSWQEILRRNGRG
jgi:hypothetical protein